MMLRMNKNTMRHLLVIKMTEIVEVTETITILIENDVLEAGQGAGYVSPVAADILTDAPESNWAQPELDNPLLNASAMDVITPLLGIIENLDKEEQPASPKST
jgi:protein-L-isoaspartate O-methyltransferase